MLIGLRLAGRRAPCWWRTVTGQPTLLSLALYSTTRVQDLAPFICIRVVTSVQYLSCDGARAAAAQQYF